MKKALSLFLVLILTLSLSVVAFAAPEEEKSVTGEGETQYIDTKVYSVVLPTDASFDFTLDPLGLANVTADGTLIDDLDGGKILGKAPQPFVNNSSFPVKLSAEIKAVATTGSTKGSAPAATGVTFVATSAFTADNKEVLLYVAPSKDDMIKADSAYAPTDDAFPISGTAITLDFALPKASYKVKPAGDTYTTEFVADSGHGNALRLGGYVNQKGDWTEFSDDAKYNLSEIGVSVKFTIEDDTANADGYTDPDYDASEGKFLLDADGVVAASARVPAVFVGSGSGGASAKSASVALSGANSGTITITPTNFTFPAGTGAAYTNYTIKGDTGNGTSTDFGIPNANITGWGLSGGELSLTLPAGWHNNGALGGWTKLVITWPTGNSITLKKASGTATTATVESVTVS